MVTMVWVVSRLRLKGPSEVGYTIATTSVENHEVHKNRWWHWGGGMDRACRWDGEDDE